MLQRAALDGWVASADVVDGTVHAHLVPLSVAWIDDHVVIAIDPDSRTARNLRSHRAVRLGIGPTRDVVLIDAVLDRAVPVADAPVSLAEAYAAQADWDPRSAPGYAYFVLRPERIQAWRESNELSGRTIMRGGRWVV